MRLNNQLSNWTINSIDFQLKNRNSKKITLPGLKNRDVLCPFVFGQDYGYTFTIWTARSHGRERQGERAYRQGRNLTMTMAIHVHVSPINVFLSSWWCNECSFGYSVTSQHGRGQIWIPTDGWRDLWEWQCCPTEIWPFPPHTYTVYAPPSRQCGIGTYYM